MDLSLRLDGTAEAASLRGAVVLAAGSSTPVQLPHGLLLATTPQSARTVLGDAETFAIPFNVSRTRNTPKSRPRTSADAGRFLSPAAVAAGRAVFVTELEAAFAAATTSAAASAGAHAAAQVDAMAVLRQPVARSTTTALLPDSSEHDVRRVADLALAWVDALGPVISSHRPPSRWSKIRRTEQRTLAALHRALEDAGCSDPHPVAISLAAGIQVPIAAGAWVLVLLATAAAAEGTADGAGRRLAGLDPVGVVWETLRMYPPTWMLPRMTTTTTSLDGVPVAEHTPVVVSPVALGLLPEVAPGPESGFADLRDFDPSRWSTGEKRPGAWLPFGAGSGACPGRNLAMAQLTYLATRGAQLRVRSAGDHRVNTTRGLYPDPAIVAIVATTTSE